MTKKIAIAGECRICHCTELKPCEIEEGLPCAWMDYDRTLCSNPNCVAQVPLDELLELDMVGA